MLRKLGKPVALAVNKIDSPKREGLAHEFHALGFEHLFPISAEHHLGLRRFAGTRRPTGFSASPNRLRRGADADSEPAKIKVAIIGRPNVGKSTLLNAFAGAERAIVSPVAGTTRDAVDETVEHKGVRIRFRRYRGHSAQRQDQADGGEAERGDGAQASAYGNVALLVLDATEGVLALDATIAGYAHEEGRALVLVVNKWDLAKGGKRKFQEDLRDSLKFLDYAPKSRSYPPANARASGICSA